MLETLERIALWEDDIIASLFQIQTFFILNVVDMVNK